MTISETLTALGNAVRSLFGTSNKYTIAKMTELINGIGKQSAKTVTPSTADQTAVASGVYTTGAVTVKGDANLKAENIAEGVSIFGVAGTHSGGAKTVRVTVDESSGYDMASYIDTDGVARKIATSKTGQVVDAIGGVIIVGDEPSKISVWAGGASVTEYDQSRFRLITFLEDGGRLIISAAGGSGD